MWLSTLCPESPGRGCSVTGNACHFCSSLIPGSRDSSICLPHRGMELPPPASPEPELPLLSRMGLSCTLIPTAAWKTELSTSCIWQQPQWQALILISGLFRLWLSWGTCLCKAHQFSLIWKTLHLCQTVNFNFNAELHCCFSSLSLLYWV